MNDAQMKLTTLAHLQAKLAFWSAKGRKDRVKDYTAAIKLCKAELEAMNDAAEAERGND